MSNLDVSDFISDHRALHVLLTCSRVHPERKQIEVNMDPEVLLGHLRIYGTF